MAFAFSSLLYPQHHDRSSRFDCPEKNRAVVRAYRVPRDAHANDVGSVYPPAGVVDRVPPYIRESAYLHTFWFKPVSSLGLFDMTMFIDSSPGLALSFLPLPLSACYWQTQRSLTGSPTGILRVRFRQLHTEGLLPLHVPVGTADGTAGSEKNSSITRLCTSHNIDVASTKEANNGLLACHKAQCFEEGAAA